MCELSMLCQAGATLNRVQPQVYVPYWIVVVYESFETLTRVCVPYATICAGSIV